MQQTIRVRWRRYYVDRTTRWGHMAHIIPYGYYGAMKTTVDIADDLYARAQSHARRTGRPVRALIEHGLRLALRSEHRIAPYRVPDCSVGDPSAPNPLEALSWQDLRDEIYGDR